MNNLYYLECLIQHYRQEALSEAHRRHLVEQTRAGRKQRSGRDRTGLGRGKVLSLLLGAKFAR